MQVEIFTVNGHRFKGTIDETQKSSLLKVQWIYLKSKKARIAINTDHIIGIYEHPHSDRKQNRGD